ncbi:MAG: thermonuclease family protein [Actinobacteria bacterium]|nr:thermonuclease family protein [Actinomycetota bacterium]
MIDGDTFVTYSGEVVRLIGINAPERGRPFYIESKEALRVLVEDETIRLEADVQDRDDYDRLLRYAYVNGEMVNAKMIGEGFANIFTLPPNLRYAELFLSLERDAVKNGKGLWASSAVTGVKIADQHFDAKGRDEENLNDEYLVISNENDFAFDINRFVLSDQAGHEFILDLVLPANGGVMVRTGPGINDDLNYHLGSDNPIWNNDYETAYLWDDEGKLVDIFIFDRGSQHPNP